MMKTLLTLLALFFYISSPLNAMRHQTSLWTTLNTDVKRHILEFYTEEELLYIIATLSRADAESVYDFFSITFPANFLKRFPELNTPSFSLPTDPSESLSFLTDRTLLNQQKPNNETAIKQVLPYLSIIKNIVRLSQNLNNETPLFILKYMIALSSLREESDDFLTEFKTEASSLTGNHELELMLDCLKKEDYFREIESLITKQKNLIKKIFQNKDNNPNSRLYRFFFRLIAQSSLSSEQDQDGSQINQLNPICNNILLDIVKYSRDSKYENIIFEELQDWLLNRSALLNSENAKRYNLARVAPLLLELYKASNSPQPTIVIDPLLKVILEESFHAIIREHENLTDEEMPPLVYELIANVRLLTDFIRNGSPVDPIKSLLLRLNSETDMNKLFFNGIPEELKHTIAFLNDAVRTIEELA